MYDWQRSTGLFGPRCCLSERHLRRILTARAELAVVTDRVKMSRCCVRHGCPPPSGRPSANARHASARQPPPRRTRPPMASESPMPLPRGGSAPTTLRASPSRRWPLAASTSSPTPRSGSPFENVARDPRSVHPQRRRRRAMRATGLFPNLACWGRRVGSMQPKHCPTHY